MSELTVKIRDAAYDDSLFDKWVHKLCDDHERLEAEYARVCNDFALLVQESGREGRELDRLEALLRAWGLEFDIRRRDAVYAEAVRLAKESE